MSFVVRNTGRTAAELLFHFPVFPSGFQASVDGVRRSVTQPPNDFATRPERRTIAPGASVTIPSAVRLRFAGTPNAARYYDRFLWTVQHPPARTALEASLGDAPGYVTCRGEMAP